MLDESDTCHPQVRNLFFRVHTQHNISPDMIFYKYHHSPRNASKIPVLQLYDVRLWFE